MRTELVDWSGAVPVEHAQALAAQLVRSPRKIAALMECLTDADKRVREHAADVAEKLSDLKPQALQPYAHELMLLLRQANEAKVLWHLALLLSRLQWKAREAEELFDTLASLLADRSSIVKTNALHGMHILMTRYPRLAGSATERFKLNARSFTPAMKARIRRLSDRGG